MGIQTISVLVAGDTSVLETGYAGVDPLSMPLNLTHQASSSKMFQFLPQVRPSSTYHIGSNAANK